MIDDYRMELESIPSMHCELPVDEHETISLLGEWVPRAKAACGDCRDDPEGLVAADPSKDCSMVHDFWGCETYDADFNGVARWVHELCPMSCGRCHPGPEHPPVMPYHPEPEHDASKCREWGEFDSDCCAEHRATTCADGYMPIMSGTTCDPENPIKYPGSEGVFFYSCVSPGEMHLPAPGPVDGHEAREVFRGLMETTERMAGALHLGHSLEEWEKFAWQRRRADHRRRALN